jgi:hypothetical protein
MTPQEQIKALAELDGWSVMQHEDGLWSAHNDRLNAHYHNFETEEGAWCIIPQAYLTSYDAIIPLIQKQSHKVQLKVRDICGNPLICKHHFSEKPITSAQLAEALLRATGKWKE